MSSTARSAANAEHVAKMGMDWKIKPRRSAANAEQSAADREAMYELSQNAADRALITKHMWGFPPSPPGTPGYFPNLEKNYAPHTISVNSNAIESQAPAKTSII